MACPENAETTQQQDLREIGPTCYFARPRVFDPLQTRLMIRMEDACVLKPLAVSLFLRCRPRLEHDLTAAGNRVGSNTISHGSYQELASH